VNTIDELLTDEQFHASGALVDVPDDEGTTTMLATPADFHGTPAAPRFRAPQLGEHTDAVLAELAAAADADG
jgi:crotonobetainyl-CoA:carnitine CoA-transferase CaiB-like acyl-CoA transferase